MTPQLQIKTLRRFASPSEYSLYRAALEWDLAEAIVIEDRKDLRSERQWRKKVQPYHHQVTNLMTFCRRLPVTLLADDVGLGKTISAGLIASELISRGSVSKLLVVCPKLLMPQWREELDVKFGIAATEAIGTELVDAKPPGETGAVITTYNSARLHFDAIAKAGYQMLILDEAHKLRNLYGVETPPQVALCFRKALAERLFKYVLMLTATPIQNRLWDLYSLVDLLTVARGHENPFGSEGMFVRNFIADGRTQARQLRADKRDEFRSIVYGYMSRVRRSDARLHFPSRKVQLQKVAPTDEEFELIELIAKPIQRLNKLAQISILQALTSSPHALAAQLETMARRETVPFSLASEVRRVVGSMRTTAKLEGLRALVDQLREEQPDRWRMVVFTGRRETQTTIEAFLTERGVSCGLINGDSGSRNQLTIARFKKDPPEIHVIVSTEAGSEGVNLQAANVLVNYDLPWNPMIVEQRIGRIQRLASVHETVCVFNVILRGTFEEYIVGRLMEKLQMASHAIGDVEALLEAAGLDEEEDSKSFADRIRELVVAALAGKNVEEATRLAEQSIDEAKLELEREEQNINAMLGGMDGAINLGPRCPRLPPPVRSMDAKSFAMSALECLGARLSPQQLFGLHVVELDGHAETIRFEDSESAPKDSNTLCQPGSPFFERLVTRIIAPGLHRVQDMDQGLPQQVQAMCESWVNSFGGRFGTFQIQEVSKCFAGQALVRIRATVAYDSFERLVELPCSSEGQPDTNQRALEPLGQVLEDPATLGVPLDWLARKAIDDPAIAEFSRFYQERLAEELGAVGEDQRKRKKLEDDLTPKAAITLAGLEGKVHRKIVARVSYKIRNEDYQSFLTLAPALGEVVSKPDVGKCEVTEAPAPCDCLGQCAITGKTALRHILRQSEVSGRMAVAEQTVICALTGKRVLADEVEQSSVTGRLIAATALKSSALSGKRAEPEFFAKCEFSGSEVLENELAVSQISGKRYRTDQQSLSVVSGRTGHRMEFVVCSETGQSLLPTEAERCEVTGKAVAPGLLEQCDVSGKKVLPTQLERCAATGKKGLKQFFVSSSVSGVRLLEREAVRSTTGKCCAPLEAKRCHWSGRQCHPEDLRVCGLTGVTVHVEYSHADDTGVRFEPLASLLSGIERKGDSHGLWEAIAARASTTINGRCKVEAAELGPSGLLAVCLEVRTWMGLRVRQAGLLYSTENDALVGRIALGKREPKGWCEEPARARPSGSQA